MDQVLSQEEIDALLSGLSDGAIEIEQKAEPDEPKQEVRTFDILQFTKSKKENLPALQFIYDRFSKSFQSALSLFLGRDVAANRAFRATFDKAESVLDVLEQGGQGIKYDENCQFFLSFPYSELLLAKLHVWESTGPLPVAAVRRDPRQIVNQMTTRKYSLMPVLIVTFLL